MSSGALVLSLDGGSAEPPLPQPDHVAATVCAGSTGTIARSLLSDFFPLEALFFWEEPMAMANWSSKGLERKREMWWLAKGGDGTNEGKRQQALLSWAFVPAVIDPRHVSCDVWCFTLRGNRGTQPLHHVRARVPDGCVSRASA